MPFSEGVCVAGSAIVFNKNYMLFQLYCGIRVQL